MTVFIPMFIVIPVAIALAIALWWAIGDMLLGKFVWSKLARRDGDILSTSRWFWAYLVLAGPVTWVLCLKERKSLLRLQAEGRQRRQRRREKAETAVA